MGKRIEQLAKNSCGEMWKEIILPPWIAYLILTDLVFAVVIFVMYIKQVIKSASNI